MSQLSQFEKLSFEDATRIIFFQFNDRKELFVEFMWDLICAEIPIDVVPRKWYEDYRLHLLDNKKNK